MKKASKIDSKTMDYIRESFKRGEAVCLTGAGISAESGIPTFRGKGGLWERYDPRLFAHSQGLSAVFRDSPERFVDFILDFYSTVLKARPNPAHLALSLLEREGRLSAVITQNIDGLHTRAGNRRVIELHGNVFNIRCQACSRKIVLEPPRLQEMLKLLEAARSCRFRIMRVLERYFPRCACGGRFRTDVVLFQEMLPEGALRAAYEGISSSSLLLLIGTSLEVYPAAGLPLFAKERGVRLIEINEQPSALSRIVDRRICASAAEVMPQVLEALGYV